MSADRPAAPALYKKLDDDTLALAKAVADTVRNEVFDYVKKAVEAQEAKLTEARRVLSQMQKSLLELEGKALPGNSQDAIPLAQVAAKILDVSVAKRLDAAEWDLRGLDERLTGVLGSARKDLEAAFDKRLDALAKQYEARLAAVEKAYATGLGELTAIVKALPRPEVHVTVPAARPPDVRVEVSKKPMRKTIQYDSQSRPATVIETPVEDGK
jgi:hypothetical protein